MKNQKVMRGVGLIAFALFFGVQAITYELGSFEKAGPGLFPLLVCSIITLIGAVMIFEARFEEPEAMRPIGRNVFIILGSLVGFVLISKFVDMLLAIVFLVFVSTLAATDYSVIRNVKICAVLIAIAFAFQQLLGLQLPLV
jgi:hypothetical protein